MNDGSWFKIDNEKTKFIKSYIYKRKHGEYHPVIHYSPPLASVNEIQQGM